MWLMPRHSTLDRDASHSQRAIRDQAVRRQAFVSEYLPYRRGRRPHRPDRPNGAGKSTLLALLAGQVEPDSGELAVRKRARAAYVPQDSRFAPGLTIRQVLEQALAAAHVQRNRTRGPAARVDRPRRLCRPQRRGRFALRRMAQAAGHHRGHGHRAGGDAARRAHQPPRPGRHRVAGRAAPRRPRLPP